MLYSNIACLARSGVYVDLQILRRDSEGRAGHSGLRRLRSDYVDRHM